MKYKKKIDLIFTGKNTDILKRITKCEKHLNKYVMICYGDTLVDIDIDKLINFFLKNKEKIILSTYNYRSQYGLLKIQSDGKVKSFKEKPDLGLFFNIGFFIMKKEHLKNLDKFQTFQGFLENKNIIKNLRSYIHKGKHITVNTLNELMEAKKNINHLKK
jgi:NDP-sugar pyrophosphorylase family protein